MEATLVPSTIVEERYSADVSAVDDRVLQIPGLPVFGTIVYSYTSSGVLLNSRWDAPLLGVVLGFGWVHHEAGNHRESSAVASPSSESSALVTALHDESGLTWEQLARMLGVTRRSLHSWAAGTRISNVNLESVSRALSQVRALKGRTPEDRRNELLDPGAAAESIFDRLRKAASERTAVVDPPLPLEVGAGL